MSVMRSSTLNVLNVRVVHNHFQIPISREEVISCASAVRIHELLSVDVAANPFGENILSLKVCRSITNAFAAPLADAKFVDPISLHKMDSQRVSRAMMANKHSGACQKSIWPLFLMHYARELEI
jgi:hypothetical protein